MTLLSIKQLSVAFRRGPAEPVVSQVSLDIPAGKTCALVGESGSGKSLTALSVLRLLPYPNAWHPGGEVLFNDQDLLTLPEAELRQIRGRDIGMIFQEPMTSLNPLQTVEQQIGETLYLHQGLGLKQARPQITALLEQVGIPDAGQRLRSYPHELSGGQRQRVMIAMALANKPKLLIADEPTTALDVTIQQQILQLLRQLQQEMGMSILLISHDLNVVRRYSDQVAVMQGGKMVESGPTEQVMQQPGHDYTRHLLNAEPDTQPPARPENPALLMQAEQLKVWFPVKKGWLQRTVSHIKAVKQLDLTLHQGETLGVVGESGSGKTTLALALLRLQEAKGEISFASQRLDSLNQNALRHLRPQMQIVFQDPFGSLSPRMSIADIICEGLDAHQKLTHSERQQALEQVLRDVDLPPDCGNRYPHEFSGGQRQRIAIARALILKPKLLVLDEPTSALDRTVQKQVLGLLRELQQRYRISYLFISHDLAVVRAISHRVLVMRHGDVIEQGSCQQIFDQPRTEYTRQLIDAALLSRTGAAAAQ